MTKGWIHVCLRKILTIAAEKQYRNMHVAGKDGFLNGAMKNFKFKSIFKVPEDFENTNNSRLIFYNHSFAVFFQFQFATISIVYTSVFSVFIAYSFESPYCCIENLKKYGLIVIFYFRQVLALDLECSVITTSSQTRVGN